MIKKQFGFTLLELMVTVAIVGILASISYPIYTNSNMKSMRVDGQGALLNFANTMERHFTVHNTYVSAPTNPGTAYYDISAVVTDSTYTLNASPKGTQANDICGTLTLTHTGVECPSNNPSCASQTVGCW